MELYTEKFKLVNGILYRDREPIKQLVFQETHVATATRSVIDIFIY